MDQVQVQQSIYSSQVGSTYTGGQGQNGVANATSQFLGLENASPGQRASVAGSYLGNQGIGPGTVGTGATLSYSYVPQGPAVGDYSSLLPSGYTAGVGPTGGMYSSAFLTSAVGGGTGATGSYLTGTNARPAANSAFITNTNAGLGTGSNLGTYTSNTGGLTSSGIHGQTATQLTTNTGALTSSGIHGQSGALTSSGVHGQTATQSTTNVGSYLSPMLSSSYGDFLGGLRTSAIHEIKTNIDNKGPQFSSELREHLQSNVVNSEPEKRQGAIVDTLKQYSLVSDERFNDPNRLWQSTAYPSGGLSQGTYTSTYTTSQNTQPTNYSATPVSNNVQTSYQTNYQPTGLTQTPEKREYGGQINIINNSANAETNKQSSRQTQSVPASFSTQGRSSILSPYRHSMYPEFSLVEDLPDRRNLIDSINLFLTKSPARETLLTSPARISIKRQSMLSPAEIEVQSLLKEKYEDGSIYEGEARNGSWNGKGRLTFSDGRTLESEFRDGKASGRGVISYKSGKVSYDGEILNNLPEGRGVLQSEVPAPYQGSFNHQNFGNLGNHWSRYEGEFRGGKKHGKGTLYLTNDERFVGEFRDDLVHGSGTYYSRDGRNVGGVWENNQYRQNL